MSAVERAVRIVAAQRYHRYYTSSEGIVQALADAGELRPEWATDEAKAVLDRLASIDATVVSGAETWVTCGNGRGDHDIVTPSANCVVRWIRGEDAS